MSTPFPLEEAGEGNDSAPRWNPWEGPLKPTFLSGTGFNEETGYLGPAYSVLEGMGSGAAKGAAVLNGASRSIYGGLGDFADAVGIPSAPFRYLEQGAQANTDAARNAVKELTPDPTTTGTAAQLLHGVAEGGYLMSTGALAGGAPGAAALVGGTEGGSRYQELKEQGVDTNTALGSAAVTAITSAAGAVMPAAYGTTLLTRTLTGAGSNVAFGAVSRYSDHQILENGGYTAMADQQKALDATQILVDAALGATFSVVHHALSAPEAAALERLRSPDNRDAAMTANLALRDRQAAPGVPVDPEAAALHQAAMDKAGADIAEGKPVDVSDTRVGEATFLARPERDLDPERSILLDSFKESGLFDEEANLRDLDEQLAKMRELPAYPAREPTAPAAEGEEPAEAAATDPIAQALTDRPDLQIAQTGGQPMGAQAALDRATEDSATAASEIPKAVDAAATCFGRRGG